MFEYININTAFVKLITYLRIIFSLSKNIVNREILIQTDFCVNKQ